MCLNDNVESIIKCNDICNRYGLDTISVGATVAWAIECYENGILNKEETGGLELTWGNAKAIVDMTQSIADQSGLGKILALGSAAAAAKLGKGAEYLQTVQGIELPMHDARLAPGYARTYQIDPTPGRHVKGGTWQGQAGRPNRYDFSINIGPTDVTMTGRMEILNASGICLFSGFLGVRDLAPKMLAAVTGWDVDDVFLKETGLRIFNMRHVFNLREGHKPSEVLMPRRLVGEPPQTEGPLTGVTIDHRTLAKNFFAAINWDAETGKPSRQSLEALGGMEDVIQNLYG
ncbi:MAG: aldehyde ferredoxin oxidoreductase C-terminal domain-containing protein [Deltaproteobacteria bacterium]|nr:aldehyde ferredoxin oxidoreductase C-terminal domain-containing protein [Deltaproteobacteria bacterium]